jgi:glycerol-3-phosphate dehydrogenase
MPSSLPSFLIKIAQTRNLPIDSSEFDDINYDEEIENIYSAGNIKKLVENEMAVSVEDVLARRTRLLFLDARRANHCGTAGCTTHGRGA